MLNRRDFLKTGVAAASSLGALRAAARDWNILVITSDEHNPKILGCAGNPTIKTPALDRLAREGTMFTHAYAADPICAPTRQSIMTGNYPQEHGQFGNSFIFNEHLRTWGDHFHDHGYTTACIGKTHTNNESAKFGFDYRNVASKGGARRTDDPEDLKAYEASPDSRFSGRILDDGDKDHDGVVCTDSIRWLKENRNKKFFLHASMVKPHWPWDAPNEFYHMYDPAKIDFPKIVPGDLDDDWYPRRTYEAYSWSKITERMHRIYRARYYGSLSWLDYNAGRLLNTLDELKLADKTLVVYSTDHGDMAGEKGMWLKSCMFDASVRVPLIVRMPGVVAAGRKCAEIINHVDYLPTLAGLVGASSGLPRNLSGKDFSQTVLGKAKGRDITFSVHGVRSWDQPPAEVMARSTRWKYMWYAAAPEGQQHVLYDMEKDPDEMTNLASRPEHKRVTTEYHDAVRGFLANLKKPEYQPRPMGAGKKGEGGDDERPARFRKQQKG